ncbi:hypothetical protein HX091_12070 [Myroides odoratimimus]|uniref:hypothetical protein n=1 Tax=Myroides odoratimimus TaxID=76832 RepID=UPI0025752AB0|nr:hypothetical protein [Myroides odoratimimus]MDM1526674.1 hypothetical protein [Myroides odoratimimus]
MAKNLFEKVIKTESIQETQEKIKKQEILFNFQITSDLRDQLKVKAIKENTSVKNLITDALYIAYKDLKK